MLTARPNRLTLARGVIVLLTLSLAIAAATRYFVAGAGGAARPGTIGSTRSASPDSTPDAGTAAVRPPRPANTRAATGRATSSTPAALRS